MSQEAERALEEQDDSDEKRQPGTGGPDASEDERAVSSGERRGQKQTGERRGQKQAGERRDEDAEGDDDRAKDTVDEASEDSFPASDPPSF